MASRRCIPSWPCGCWAKAMAMDELLSQLRLRLPEAAEEENPLLSGLLQDAGALIRALTWREEIPSQLQGAQVRLAVIFYNRMGMEGETEHAEGDVRRTAADLPDGLRREILAYRLAKT